MAKKAYSPPCQSERRRRYSGKSLIDKLGWKEGSKAIVIAPPANYHGPHRRRGHHAEEDCPRHGSSTSSISSCRTWPSLARDLPKLEPRLAEGGMIWVSWPKKTSAMFRDLTEDGIRKVCLPLGLVDVKVCAVDCGLVGPEALSA